MSKELIGPGGDGNELHSVPKGYNMSYIPKELKIFFKPQIQEETTEGDQIEIQFIQPGFVTDKDRPKTHATALKWAAGYKKKNQDEVITVERSNEPFEGLKVYNISYRNQGGHVYQVLTREGWRFDCREDVILDTMMNAGISKGGIMKGKFVWARVGSQMKVIRVGSELYEKASQDTAKQKQEKIKIKDLVVGGVYTNVRGDTVIYKGRNTENYLVFDNIFLEVSKGKADLTSWKTDIRARIKKYETDLAAWIDSPVVISGYGFNDLDRREWGWRPNHPIHSYLTMVKSHSYVQKIGQFTDEELTEFFEKPDGT